MSIFSGGKTRYRKNYDDATIEAYKLVASEADPEWITFKRRVGLLLIGSIAVGFVFNWVAGVAALFLFLSILPTTTVQY